jgi:hypothetical protein
MRSVPLEIIDGHLVARLPDGRAVLDTGSPITMRAPALVSQALGQPIRWLVGVDRLRRAPVLFDWPARRFVEDVAPDTFAAGEGTEIPLRSVFGVFLLPIVAPDGKPAEAFLDSGAKLSYAPAEAVGAIAPVGTETDFYPGFGEFEVAVYALTVTVGGRAVTARFGVLPDALQMLLSLTGISGWILGSDLFRDRRIVLDLAAGRMIDVTVRPPQYVGGSSDNSEGGMTSDEGLPGGTPGSKADMMKAYRAAQRIVDAELSADDRELLRATSDHDLIVVRGSYDRVEDVLRLAGIPHRVVDAEEIPRLALTPRQMVIVNCPGKIEPEGLTTLRRFVEAGGSLVTTDWALKHVLEEAFPGFVAYNQRSTGDEVVRIEVRSSANPWLAGMFHAGADPLWWLEGASYPICVLDPERVEVLLTSRELGDRYGEAPVAVAFRVGSGDVLHMISHYYLQRAELRTARHGGSWKEYAAEVGAGGVAAEAPSVFDDLRVADVEAAHKSLRFMTNMVLEKQRKNRHRSGKT